MMKKIFRSLFAGAALLAAGSSVFAADSAALKSVPGVRGNAISLDGSAYLEDATNKPFDFKNGLTVSVWLKLESIAHMTEIVGNAGSFYLLKRTPSCGDGFYFWDKYTGNPLTILWAPDSFKYTPRKWFHLAVTYDQKGTAYGYLNGKRVAVQRPGDLKGQKIFQVQDRPRQNTQRFCVAKGNIKGAMDELYIYGKVLSDAEIAALYAGKAPNGALAAYLMDDARQPGVDASAFKRNLSITKAPAAGK